jgi:hypothetical protein
MSLSILELRSLLKENNKNYTDEELEKVRDFFEMLGEIIYGNYQRKRISETNKSHR